MKKTGVVLAALLGSGVAIADVDHNGFYLGGSLGRVDFTASYDNQPVYQTGKNLDEGIGSASVLAGYNFSQIFGLELEMVTTGDLASNKDYEASAFQIMVSPRLALPLGEHVSLYGKVGAAVTAYAESWDDVTANKNSNAEDTLAWGGTSLTAGVGLDVTVFSGLNLRLAYDYTDVNDLSASDTTVKDGNGGTWKVPDIGVTLKRASVGLFWQF